MQQRQLDERAAAMLEMYENARFQHPRTSQRLRLQLVAWVIRNKIAHNLKRALDLVGSGVLLVLTSPILAATAIAVKLDSPGPVLFRQERVGLYGEPFVCYKFRSMYVDAEERKQELMAMNEADGPIFKIKHDPRVTRVGRFIRKVSVDELPQLFNVWRGEMSLVGPRPAVPKEVAAYQFDERRRLEAVPGLTGLQQVSGRSDLDFKRWVELDLQYIAEQSLLKDVEILLKTIPAVISGKGAY
jgi:exopolysaccharide biosynthesis polyprenyl glycosylphosphotransferase